MNKMRDRIKSGLQIAINNSGDGWIVIFEEPESEKFLQFAIDEESGLYFDCPSISFSNQEKQRAQKVMKRYQIEENAPADDKFTTYGKNMGYDIETSVALATEVFKEIFLFDDDTLLNITIRN